MKRTYNALSVAGAFIAGSLILYLSLYALVIIFPLLFIIAGIALWLKIKKPGKSPRPSRIRASSDKIIDVEYEIINEKPMEKKK